MKSSLTLLLDKYSEYFLSLNEKYNLKLYNTINAGLILNAFALLNLYYGEFIVFIGLSLLGYFTSIIEENHENKTKFEIYYSNLALWIKILSLYFFVSVIFYKKINTGIVLLVLMVLILCNVNYSIDYIIKSKINKTPIDVCHKIMAYPYKKWDNIKLTRTSRIMRNFDEPMTMLYIITIICYLRAF